MPMVTEYHNYNELKSGLPILQAEIGDSIWRTCDQCYNCYWALIVEKEGTVIKYRGVCPTCQDAWDNPPDRERRIVRADGYAAIRVSPRNFYYPMANSSGYIAEHRLVMARSLGRLLQPWEIVHHINGIREDNRLENLQLIQEMQHKQLTIIETHVKHLEKRIAALEKENKDLKAKLSLGEKNENRPK